MGGPSVEKNPGGDSYLRDKKGNCIGSIYICQGAALSHKEDPAWAVLSPTAQSLSRAGCW